MKKQFLLTLLLLLLTAGIVCAEGTQESKSNDTKETFIAFSTCTLGIEFFKAMDVSIERECEKAGIRYECASSEMDSTVQSQQIDNFVTMGATNIIVMALDVPGVQEAMIAAREKGVHITVAGSVPTDKRAYDACVVEDQREEGLEVAKNAAKWIEATFPNAKPESIEIGIIEYVDVPTFKERSDALSEVTNYTDKVKIVAKYQVSDGTDSAAKTQEYTGMLLSSHPDVKMILCYSDGYAVAANEVVMHTAGIDYPNFAIFGCAWSDVIASAIKDSADNSSVIRGTLRIALDLGENFYNVSVGNYPVDENNFYWNKLYWVNTDNIDEHWKP